MKENAIGKPKSNTAIADLDKINWNRLYHAYGIATDTPNHMQNLLSHDLVQRNNAIGHLFSAVLHQGTVYTVTPIVVQILISVLHDPVLNEDMSEFYREKYKARLAQTKKELSSPNITDIMKKPLLHRCTQLEKVLASQDGNNGLVQVLSFFDHVGESLSYNEVPIENSSPSAEELDTLFNSASEEDDNEEFWISPLHEKLTNRAIFDLFRMADDVLASINCFVSDANLAVMQTAKNAAASWAKVAAKKHGHGLRADSLQLAID